MVHLRDKSLLLIQDKGKKKQTYPISKEPVYSMDSLSASKSINFTL
jgi:hypothetical protein